MQNVCKVGFIGVLLAIVPAEKGVLWAQTATNTATNALVQPVAGDAAVQPVQPAQPTQPANPLSFQYAAKVIVFDRAAKTVTVDIQNRLYLLKLAPDATVTVQGKTVSTDQLVADQDVTLNVVQDAKGDIRIVSVLVSPAKTKAEAAGKKSHRK
jgi:hypothetical protein